MKSSAFLSLLGVALAVASPARAQDMPLKDAAVRKVVHDYARCVVKKRGDLASEVILSNVPNFVISKRYGALLDSDCMGFAAVSQVGVHFVADSLRYALADALVSAHFAGNGPASFADRLPLAHLALPDRTAFDLALAKVKRKKQREAMEKHFNNSANAAWLSQYGECIVRQEPEKARRWLLTAPDIPEEMSRINDLAPAFAPCLPTSAGKVRFSRTTMRGAVAINYYRLAMATVQPPAGKVN